jgi:hypothetical protein
MGQLPTSGNDDDISSGYDHGDHKWMLKQETKYWRCGPASDHDDCHIEAGRLAASDDGRYVSEGLDLYFLCGIDSQKARNLAIDDRVAVTIDHDTSNIMAITGLSMAGHARPVKAEQRRKGFWP